MKKEEIYPYWNKLCSGLLLGKTIVKVRYLTQVEMKSLGWYSSGVVLQLNDGNLILPSKDDEGNDTGTLFISGKKSEILAPVVNTGRDATVFLQSIRKEIQHSPIVKAEYMSVTEAEKKGWYSCPLMITLLNGTTFYSVQGSSCNDGGALFTSFKGAETFPIIGTYISN